MTYGIVLLLDRETTQKAIELSRKYIELADDPNFVLGTEINVPHISMIHLELDDRGLSVVSALVEMSIKGYLARARTDGLGGVFDTVATTTPQSSWLFWNTPLADDLFTLHRLLVVRTSFVRNKDVYIRRPMNEAQRHMHQLYGYPYVMECFNPHITLGVTRKEFAGYDGGSVIQPWKADALALAEIGDRGRVARIIRRMPLNLSLC